jgi:hypothetical protein
MQIRVENNLVEFSGYLSEKSDADIIRKGLMQAASFSSDGSIRIDFSKVEKANSVGILTYLKTFLSMNLAVVYERVPIWLVEQFNVIDEFLVGNAVVASLYAQFYCPETNRSQMKLLHVGKDIPIQKDYADLDLTTKDEAGNSLEPDFDPATYFYFLSIHNDRHISLQA